MPIAISNVMLVCPACGQTDPHRRPQRHEDGSKHRYCKRKDCGKEIGQIAPPRKKKARRHRPQPDSNSRSAELVSCERVDNRDIKARNYEPPWPRNHPRKPKLPPRPAGKPPVPRLLEKYEKELLPGLAEEIRPHQSACAAAAEKDRHQHGRRRGDDRKEILGGRGGRR